MLVNVSLQSVTKTVKKFSNKVSYKHVFVCNKTNKVYTLYSYKNFNLNVNKVYNVKFNNSCVLTSVF